MRREVCSVFCCLPPRSSIFVLPVRTQYLNKYAYNLRIKMSSALTLQELDDLCARHGLSIGTVTYQSIPHIHDRKHPGGDRNFLPPQASRVARAIPLFMMAMGNLQS